VREVPGAGHPGLTAAPRRLQLHFFDAAASDSVFVEQATCDFCDQTLATCAPISGLALSSPARAPIGGAQFGCLRCFEAGRFFVDNPLESFFTTPPQLSAADRARLQATPPFRAWQGAQWLCCCAAPMTFIGVWDHADFELHGHPKPAAAYFAEIGVNAGEFDYDREWSPRRSAHAEATFYAFRCGTCGRHLGYADCP